MSYEVWVQRFDREQPAGLSVAAFAEILGPYVTDSQPQFHFHRSSLLTVATPRYTPT
jgi:hypothetical protein